MLSMADVIVGAVAVILIIYLFAVVLRPEWNFDRLFWKHSGQMDNGFPERGTKFMANQGSQSANGVRPKAQPTTGGRCDVARVCAPQSLRVGEDTAKRM